MIAGLKPPPDWRDRDDAAAFGDAVARLAFAEADVLRCEERLRVAAPLSDGWESLYDWEDAYGLLGALEDARADRDRMRELARTILERWQ